MNDQSTKFLNSIKPKEPFSASNLPPEPSYSDLYSWVAHPEVDGYHQIVPKGENSISKSMKDIDVFFIHPTGFFGKNWNGPVDRNHACFQRSEIYMASQASSFYESCNIFAPEYRQATYYCFFDLEGNGYQAQDVAYSDIERAFDYYMEHHNNGRPFFIASHSQGSLHAQRLIYNRIAGKELTNQFIAAYLIGYIVPLKHFDLLFSGLKNSNSSNDTQSIISWGAGVEGFTRPRAHAMYWTPDEWIREAMEQPLVCQNPITWNSSSDWVTNTNQISIRLKSSEIKALDYYATQHAQSKISIEYTDVTEMEVRISPNHMIELRGPLIDKVSKLSVNGDLHNFDIQLFWKAIRNNIKDRIASI